MSAYVPLLLGCRAPSQCPGTARYRLMAPRPLTPARCQPNSANQRERDFRLSATSPTAATVATSGAGQVGSAVLAVCDRLLVYAGSHAENLLFESRAGDG